jgi:hypothetical protein
MLLLPLVRELVRDVLPDTEVGRDVIPELEIVEGV